MYDTLSNPTSFTSPLQGVLTNVSRGNLQLVLKVTKIIPISKEMCIESISDNHVPIIDMDDGKLIIHQEILSKINWISRYPHPNQVNLLIS